METLLRYEHVDISYGESVVIHEACFSLAEGEILGIVGESGSGKSTILKAAMNLLGWDGLVTRGDIWYRGKNSEPVTDEQVAAQMQQAEPLVIETPEAAAEGSIRVYDYDGCCIYAYYGKIQINNDGKDGKDIDVEAIGYLEGYQEHKGESEAGNE